MRQFIDDQPPRPFVFIIHPNQAVDMARELDKCCVYTCEVLEDGVRVIHIQDVPHPEELTLDQRWLLGAVDGMRFKKVARLSPLPFERPLPYRDPRAHMDQLRRKTGQDWRGRR